MKNNDIVYAAASFACLLLSLLLLKLSSFSASSMVNFQNYIIKTGIASTTGMSTLSALYYFLGPFYMVFAGLVLFAVSVSIIAAYSFNRDNKIGIFTGIISAAAAVAVFQSLWSIFIGVGLFAAFFTASKMAPVYRDEIKKWRDFRSGSKTISRALFFMNILVVLGVFFAVLSAQSAYAVSFRSEMADVMKLVMNGIPGVPSIALDHAVDQAINSSEIFNSYIRWLPVTTALGALFLLELLRNIFLSNIAGLVTFLMSRKISF